MKKLSLRKITFIFLFIASILGAVIVPTFTRTIDQPAIAETKTSFADPTDDGFWSATKDGGIPYSLYTNTTGLDPSLPSYTKYDVENGNVPYILLSSQNTAGGGRDNFYNTTLYFSFNNPQAKVSGRDPTINTEGNASALLVNAKLYSTDTFNIVVDRSLNTNDVSFDFELNLLPSDNEASKVPEYTLPNESTRYPINIPADRTGLYTFEISYNYTNSENWTSDSCSFSVSFYVLDFYNYVEGTGGSAISIENTDNLGSISEEFAINHIYNYNHENMPTVSFDATKFGLYFSYETGVYSSAKKFTYENSEKNKSFKRLISYTPENLLNTPYGTVTGSVTLTMEGTGKQFPINTIYKEADGVKLTQDIFYYAQFDLGEFEKFLVENGINNSCMGDYTFGLYFLIGNNNGYSIVDTTGMETMLPDDIKEQTLTAFGFRLDYLNKELKRNTELKNSITHSNVYAVNSVNETAKVDLPSLIPITNQAPLTFEKYGKMFSGLADGIAKYAFRSYGDANAEQNALTALENHINGTETMEFNETYEADTQITADGIYIMKVEYKTTVSGNAITGTQYFIFEINNTLQNLLIQGVSDDGTTVYDIDTYTNKSLRVSIRTQPNTILSPAIVTYRYYSNFSLSSVPVSGSLTLKQSGNVPEEFSVRDYRYNYYVTDQANNYTFSKYNSGYYYIYITSGTNSSTTPYVYCIDNTGFEEVKVHSVAKNSHGFYVTTGTIAATPLSGTVTDSVLKYDMVITNTDFTLSWKPKASGAKSYSKVYSLEMSDNTEAEIALIEQGSQHWLTNGCKTKTLTTQYEEYENSYSVLSQALSKYNRFSGSGLYMFFVYDDAGNSFYYLVMIDNSKSEILQGNYEDPTTKTGWKNSFDKNNNPANYVKETTTLLFGTHKSIEIPDITTNFDITITDKSYSVAYNTISGSSAVTDRDSLFSFNFLDNALSKTTYYGKTLASSYKIGTATNTAGYNHFINIPISSIAYTREVTDPETQHVTTTSGTLNPATNWETVIYANNNNFKDWSGEAYYVFTVKPANQVRPEPDVRKTRAIEMNFDAVEGTFYAYGEDNIQRYIRKNSATNLNILMFTYLNNKKAENELESMYEVGKLVYTYYEFQYTNTTTNYPFKATPTKENVDMLVSRRPSEDGRTYIIDGINVDDTGKVSVTKPGKYVITRTYVGGGYDEHGNEVHCGKYKKVDNGDGTFSYELVDYGYDSHERSYTVYVDRNGIISTTYMDDEDFRHLREVGDNISIELSTGYEDNWIFKNFFRTTSDGVILTTNKIPVKVNIPLSKYFFNAETYSELNFAKLSVKIVYRDSNIYAPTRTYVIDGFDPETKYCTCSALIGPGNPRGDLIFNGEGSYTITIHDNTGYTDTEVLGTVNPTTLTLNFTVKHQAPEGTFEVNNNELTNYDEVFDEYATNLKDEAGNNLNFTWEDPADPYTAKIKNLQVVARDAKTNSIIKTESIDLTMFSAPMLVVANPFNPNQYTHIKAFGFALSESEVQAFDGIDYYKYSYYITLNIQEEITYEIIVSYVSPSTTSHGYGNFVSNTFRVLIDRTKPNTNIDSLIANETYLVSAGYYADVADIKANFKEEAITEATIHNFRTKPTIYDYTFGVSNNYKLGYIRSNREMLSTFYFRKYDKYNGSNSSLTPDSHFTANQMSTYFSNYPRFNPQYLVVGSDVWYLAEYSNNTKSLRDVIAETYTINGITTSAKNVSGFYEIIERDLAGNYRCFTVYIGNGTEHYSLIQLEGTHLNGITHSATNNREITANLNFSATDIDTTFGWGTLSVKSTDSKGSTITLFTEKVSPYDNYSTVVQRLREINNQLVTSTNKRFTISVAKYNNNFTGAEKYINIIVTATKLAAPEIKTVVKTNANETTTTTYTLEFPKKTESTPIFLTYLKVVDKTTGTDKQLLLCEDLDSMVYSLADLKAGTYEVTYKDNFNGAYSYSYTVYPGMKYVSNNEHLQYEYESTKIGDTIYSGGTITVTYENKIYLVWISKNGGTEVEVSNATEYELSDYGEFKRFKLKSTHVLTGVDADSAIGGVTEYVLRYVDANTANTVKTEKFVIYNELPAIYLKDEYNNYITATSTPSVSSMTTSALKVNWGELVNYPNTMFNSIVATLYTQAPNSNIYTNPKILNNGQEVKNEGYYKLVLSNGVLGNTRIVYFAITESELPFYTVVVDNEEESLLQKSPLALNLNTNQDTWGFTLKESVTTLINSSAIDIVTKDFLIAKLSDTIQTANIEHYFTIYDSKVVTNSSMNLEVLELYYINNIPMTSKPTSQTDYVTTFYYIYGLNDPIYAGLVAVTKVPDVTNLAVTNNIITKVAYHNTEINDKEDVYTALRGGYQKTLTNKTTSNNEIVLYWNTSSGNNEDWYNKGNYVLLNYSFNKNSSTNRVTGTVLNNGFSTATLKGSGSHNLKFFDLAGNQFKFVSTYYTFDSYNLYLIDKVIFKVNDDSKNLQYATYNDAVTLSLDDFYTNYYAETSISVTKNGSRFTGYEVVDGKYVFTSSGKYVVTFNGTAKVEGIIYTLDPSVYNFTIIQGNTTRLAYEFSEMNGYEIVAVTKDGVDITNNIKAKYGKEKITSLFLSPLAENFGNGYYTITMSILYNELLDPEIIKFSVTINDAIPVITSDPLPGETTKGTVILTYNPYLIFSQIGKCKIVILTYNPDTNMFSEYASQVIDETNSASQNLHTVELTDTNNYFIQLVSDSDNVVLSFRVNRAEPLNAVSIIVIVAGAIALVVGIILFIKLRTRMKIR